MLKNKFVFTNCLVLMILLLLSGTSSSIAANLSGTESVGLKDGQILWFHTLRLFVDSKDAVELNPTAVKEQREKIDKILDAGINPIGAVNSWIFPDSVNAPKVPGPEYHMGVKVQRIDVIPPFNTAEYARLMNIRAQFFETLAAEFPEVETWIIGFEGNYTFKDLDGQDIDLDTYGTFVLNTLESSHAAIIQGNSKASTIGHFLGRLSHPIYISGEIVQPSQIINLINNKMLSTGLS